jgi:hypothetical protein
MPYELRPEQVEEYITEMVLQQALDDAVYVSKSKARQIAETIYGNIIQDVEDAVGDILIQRER